MLRLKGIAPGVRAYLATIFHRIANLRKLERRRVDTTLTRIHKQPWMMFVFNAFLLTLNACVRVNKAVIRAKERFQNDPIETVAGNDAGLTRSVPRSMNTRAIKILLVVEESVQQCFTYRVAQKLEQFKLAGYRIADAGQGKRARWISWREYRTIREIVHYYDIVIFYRVPGFPDVLSLMEYIRSINRITIYDIDDLIFDKDELRKKFRTHSGQLPKHELNAMMKGAQLYHAAMQRCTYGMASTSALAERVEQTGSIKKCFVLPNGLDPAVVDVSSWGKAPKPKDLVYIFYGSGTKTHDEDFELVAPALDKMFQKHPQLRLVIAGYLTLPKPLHRHDDRITRLPLMDFSSYLEVLSQADINIAPLEPGVFADCKSEIKWIEAGALGICNVVSATSTYARAIDHGSDAFVAHDPNEWLDLLDHVISDEETRERIGHAARAKIFEKYSMARLSSTTGRIIDQVLEDSIRNGVVCERSNEKRRLVYVNTVYPPQAFGGATVVMCNIVNKIKQEYSARFELYVFTCDGEDPIPYQIKEYEHQGVMVTALSMPTSPDLEWRYRDEEAKRIFAAYLEAIAPDIVHFHSVQRLTGSVVDAARELEVPYFVTVHDAWWLSDHQFLVDESGNVVDEIQTNPLSIANNSKDPLSSIERLTFLRRQLRQARKVLTVSRYQADLYERNGILNVALNVNGVDREPHAVTRGEEDHKADGARKLTLGYLGGISRHKGYYVLQEAVSGLELDELEFVVVDFNAEDVREEKWGTSRVKFVPQITPDAMGAFYAGIDILVAPSIWPESFGLVTREAALAGKWIICSDSGGLAEVVKETKNGWTFPPGDVNALQKLLQRCDAEFSKYQVPPSVNTEDLGIRSVAVQVDELMGYYKQVLTSGNKHDKREEAISAA